MKRWGGLVMLFMLLCVSGVRAQQEVLMVINGEEVSCAEYRDFCARRNVVGQQTVDAFIDYKLLIGAARQLGLDTVSSFRASLDSCRHGLSRRFLLERTTTDAVFGEHRDVNRVLVSHLFQYLPQNVTASRLRACEVRMDSLYQAICSGEISFEDAVQAYSQEKEPLWVGRLEMPVEFEQVAFTLSEGQYSTPFFTPEGIHMVKVLQRESFSLKRVPTQRSLKVALDSLKLQYHFKPDETGIRDFLLHGFTDKHLFSLAGKSYSGKELALFQLSHPASPQRQLDDFIAKTIWAYADSRLEADCPDYSLRLRAYSDSLLYQSITERVLGDMVSADTVGIETYFEHHRKDYRWPETRYEGIVLHCVSKRVGKRVKNFLKKLPAEEWQDAIRLGVNAESPVVGQVEQGLFAPGDNPYIDARVFKIGKARPVADYPYTLVLGAKKKGPERWEEVGNKLWDDYRNYRKACWMEELRGKAKVEINQEVLKTVNNH